MMDDDQKNWGGVRPGAGRPKKSDKRTQITVTLNPATIKQIDALASKSGISRSKVIEKVLSQTDFEGIRLIGD